MDPLVLEKNISKCFQRLLFNFFAIIPVEKGRDSSFKQIWISLYQSMLFAKIGWHWPSVVLEKETKMWKVYLQTDDGQ